MHPKSYIVKHLGCIYENEFGIKQKNDAKLRR